MRTRRNSINPRARARRKTRHPPSSRTLKALKDLTYVKGLSSEALQKKYKGSDVGRLFRRRKRTPLRIRPRRASAAYSSELAPLCPECSVTERQKRAFNAYLIKTYGRKKWGEDADSVLGKEYRRFRENPEKVLEEIKTKKGGGDRRPASKADMPVHPGSQKYFIHDNGGRPFLVYVAGNKVWIYKHSKETIVEDQKDFDNPKYYTELVKEYNAKQVFIGKSPKNEMTKYSGGHGSKFTGNSILLKIGDKRYVSIGWTIYEFSTKDEITEYHSPVGNNDVPYPVAIGKNYVYFMIEDVYVAKELFEDFPQKYTWHDHAYAKLWGQEPFTEQNKSNMKKHRQKMMNVKMVHKRIQ